MRSRKAVILTLDGWSANFLGPYGNTWVETSALNGLARDALVVENAYADCVDLDAALASLWQGRHALCTPRCDAPALGDLLSDSDRTTHLITDDPIVARHRLAARMSAVTLIEVADSQRPARDPMQTRFGQFLANAASVVEQDESDCVWIHAKAFLGSWDAPFELRLVLTDEEEDPDPSDSVTPPDDASMCADDPDNAWSLSRAYGAEVMSADRCLEYLFDVLDDHPVWRDSMMIVTSPRGYPLGEHGKVGLVGSPSSVLPLHGEILHVPLFVRCPVQDSLLSRSEAITQSDSILATLLDWLEISPTSLDIGERSLLRLFGRSASGLGLDRAVSRSDSELSMRTPGWFLRLANCGGDPSAGDAMLYVKPDDRWEANEVANRCQDVVEAMRVALREFATAAVSETPSDLRELPELLFASTI